MRRAICILVLALASCSTGLAQTNAFSYQGSLQNSGAPSNGNHDFEFVLFDAVNGGSQIGLLARNGVSVTNGVFSVQLDFPAGSFTGAARFLEIRVRPAGQPGFTILAPRQPVDSAPYSIRSLNAEIANNALQLGGVAANQFVITTDPRMTNARTPTAGSGDYIQNSVAQQTGSFNIAGSGTAGVRLTANLVRASSGFELGGSRVIHNTGGFNMFVGVGTGSNLTTGTSNSVFGHSTGIAITTGTNNSIFGSGAGLQTTTGLNNSFFGLNAGRTSTAADDNSFFGYNAGYFNLASGNSFFGSGAGFSNSTGNGNSFFGSRAGEANLSGVNNAFFGANAGAANTTALGNSFFGANSGAANTTAQGNSFFGASTGLVNNGANNSFFGTVAGVANTSGFANSFFGHWAGHENTTGDNNTFVGRSAGEFSTTGNGNTFVGQNSGLANTTGSNNTMLGANTNMDATNLTFATAIGAGALVTDSNMIVIGRTNHDDTVYVPGVFRMGTFAIAATEPLCANFGSQVGFCLGSAGPKENVTDFTGGLNLVRRMRPISFTWKNDRKTDVGFNVDEVAAIEPRLVERNSEGQAKSVKSGQISAILVNAVKEQQTQIESQAETIERQQKQIDALTKLVCATNAAAEICR